MSLGLDDYFICINNTHNENLLTKGKIYRGLELTTGNVTYVIDDNDRAKCFYSYRFKKLPNTELSKVLYDRIY